ncbi:MAG: hypothetical protein GX754_11835 [Clostridiaceae bacterium]|nr:hypothetical protein [Clostridiaceae bacterium]
MNWDLPPMSIFPNSTPRYPNLWIYVNCKMAENYNKALYFVVERLKECAEVYNDFECFHIAEGCDYFTRRRGLFPVGLGEKSHDHELHLRFYTQPLKSYTPLEIYNEKFYRIAISVHFEVDRPAKLHAYVDKCPVCGCTGEYKKFFGAETRVKNENVHDPLGLELILHGTIRGKSTPVFKGINYFDKLYKMIIEEDKPSREDINTARIGQVFFIEC